MSTPDGWREDVAEHRADKDEFFREHPQSPIPHDQREVFEGLSYFDPDPAYRFEVELHEHDTKETVTVATTTEGERDYVEWGEFRFTVDGEECTLQAYSRGEDAGGDEFWLPFRDETSGEETYGAGRYLELDAEDRTDDGAWVLDFNDAYSPFCAYNEAYECPLVPMANWLDVEIRAGEKTYTPGGE